MKLKTVVLACICVYLMQCNLRLVAVDRPAVTPPVSPTTQPVIAQAVPTEWYADQNLWTYVGGAVAAVGLAAGYVVKRRK